MRAECPEGGVLSLSASSLLVSPQLTGISEQMRLIELVPPFSTLGVGAWAHSSHFGRVCSQVPERWRPGCRTPSAAPSYPPPSAAPASSPRTCVWLLSGHPFVPLSTPLPTQGSRRWWQRRLEGGPEGWVRKLRLRRGKQLPKPHPEGGAELLITTHGS